VSHGPVTGSADWAAAMREAIDLAASLDVD
jgi:hypothetical protein